MITDLVVMAALVAVWFCGFYVGGRRPLVVICPGCGLEHDPEPCIREAATCDCCAAIQAEGAIGT